ncbi:Albumin-2 [Bienertia sinuspersici]
MPSKIPSWRACASNFAQPLSLDDEQEAQSLVDTVDRINCKEENLHKIVYRTGEAEKDILRQVFRWDIAPYDYVFEHGLQSHHRRQIPRKTFYSLSDYVQSGQGRPSTRGSRPTLHSSALQLATLVYRYEIYAPGGIWTSLTLGDKDHRKIKRFDEVAFVGGVAPQYIRSAQLFKLTGNSDGTTTIEKANNMLLINGEFNPQSHPLRLLKLENPVIDYTIDNTRISLSQTVHRSSSDTTTTPTTTYVIDWYAFDVANRDIYLSATFRSSHLNEAYYISQNCCTLLYYDPTDKQYHRVDGPSFLAKKFKSLEYTPFGEHGIDGAVQLHGDEAFIFCADLVAVINYAPDTKNDKIVKGPMIISEMFPFLKETVFENGIDCACELKSTEYEAYLFKGNLCAHIGFGPSPRLIALGDICQFIPLLKGTVYEGLGLDATYGSHDENDDEVAHYFKYNNHTQINVNVKDGLEYVLAKAPVIHSIPLQNRGLDKRGKFTALPNSDDAYDNA